ncbi:MULTISPECIES: DUF2066 domain-containing protein [unclassified Thalassospira]|uniref:DUF2066 domain-containing protein n=1 Tax=unclassified Thalassospira TaxID=2648997 RepID=UPI001FEDBEAF|nr:DUF2066 domain-containing protein [Thalassospira sp. MCCC 1A01428]
MLDRLKPIHLLAGMIAGILVLVTAAATPAVAQDLYTVSGVHVDERADSATKARDVALASGQRAAFSRLINRLTVSDGGAGVATPDQRTITNMVRDFGVSNEKTSSVRYIADMTVRFKADQVRAFLRNRNVPFAETTARKVLILPVYSDQGYTNLWDDPNPWRDAWNQVSNNSGLVPVTLAVGDLGDIGTVSVEQAQGGDQAAIDKIGQRYGANVAVADATMSGSGNGQAVDVSVTRYDAGGAPQVFGVHESQAEGESVSAMLQRAAADVRARLESSWKQASMIDYSASGELMLFVPITSMDDWAGIESRLENLPVIKLMRVVAMSRREVQVDVEFAGTPDQFRVALAQQNLDLQQIDQLWFVEPSGSDRLAKLMGNP